MQGLGVRAGDAVGRGRASAGPKGHRHIDGMVLKALAKLPQPLVASGQSA